MSEDPLYVARRPDQYIHFEVQQSAYAGKTRSYLRKKGIPFRACLTAHPRYANIVRTKMPRWRIPILEAPDGTIVQDTSEIIDFLEQRYPEDSIYPSGPRQQFVAFLIEAYGDEGLSRHMMHYRWNFSDNDTFMAREMARSSEPQSSLQEADIKGEKFVQAMRDHLPGLGVSNSEVQRVTEESWMDILDILDEHFRLYPYLLGGKPSLGDFGLTVAHFAHLGRDPHSLRLMQTRAPFVFRWVERMQASDANMTEFPGMQEAFLAHDEVPETLIPLLRLIAGEFGPQIEACISGIEKRASELLATEGKTSGLPVLVNDRASGVGRSEIDIRGVKVPVGHTPITQWKFQRSYDFYQNLSGTARSSVKQLIDVSGLTSLYEREIKYPILRRNFREIFA